MRTIPLTRGLEAQVNDEDYAILSQYRWHAAKTKSTFYAVRKQSRKIPGVRNIYMHHDILGSIPDGREVDHRDRNGLNNQRDNLRIATVSQNRANTKGRSHKVNSRYRGVTYKVGGYNVAICINKHRKHLGRFKNAEQAALVYNTAAKAAFGEFAMLNIISRSPLSLLFK